MTGGFLENYNLLGLCFIISAVLLIVSMFKMQHGETNRFKNKKSMKDWVKYGQFRTLIEKYQTIIWKGFFVFFCLSTIPLIFAVPSKAMTQIESDYEPSSIFEIISQKLSYGFLLLFMFALYYTSVPKIFYNNQKNFLKTHIVKQECAKFRYDAKYCMYFELHYLIIACILAFAEPTKPVLYTLSSVNGLFLLYLLMRSPYESLLDNIGAIMSNLVNVYFFSINLYKVLTGNTEQNSNLLNLSGFIIVGALVI